MSCKLATLIQARKHSKFFANQGLSLPPLAADSYRGLYSKVLQCALWSLASEILATMKELASSYFTLKVTKPVLRQTYNLLEAFIKGPR
jgi:hypothetical protein